MAGFYWLFSKKFWKKPAFIGFFKEIWKYLFFSLSSTTKLFESFRLLTLAKTNNLNLIIHIPFVCLAAIIHGFKVPWFLKWLGCNRERGKDHSRGTMITAECFHGIMTMYVGNVGCLPNYPSNQIINFLSQKFNRLLAWHLGPTLTPLIGAK